VARPMPSMQHVTPLSLRHRRTRGLSRLPRSNLSFVALLQDRLDQRVAFPDLCRGFIVVGDELKHLVLDYHRSLGRPKSSVETRPPKSIFTVPDDLVALEPLLIKRLKSLCPGGTWKPKVNECPVDLASQGQLQRLQKILGMIRRLLVLALTQKERGARGLLEDEKLRSLLQKLGTKTKPKSR